MRRFLVALVLAIFSGIVGAQAQNLSIAAVDAVVPFPPGGSTDRAARIMAERMRATLGPADRDRKCRRRRRQHRGRARRPRAPDGYTFDIGQWDTHVGSIIYKLDYDLEKDFEPIALISNNPQLMVAKNDLPADNSAELVTWMKAKPGQDQFRQPERGGRMSPACCSRTSPSRKCSSFPYRGAGPAMTDLISGTVDLLVVQGAVALPQIRAGKIKALANLSAKRSASMPDIPTPDETGVPGLYMSGWFGFFAPKGTPKDVIARLNARPSRRLPIRLYRSGLRSWGSTSPRANSRRRKGWPRSRKPRSTNGGRSSSLPVSARRRNEMEVLSP
jgi:tripartite-type tricarboxylate transporter receptor subunit TctC